MNKVLEEVIRPWREMVEQLEGQVKELKQRGNLESLKFDFTAQVVSDLAELQRFRTAQMFLLSAVYDCDGVEVVKPFRVCDQNKGTRILRHLSLAEDLGQAVWSLHCVSSETPKAIRVSKIEHDGNVASLYDGEECDLRTQDELAEFIDDYVNADGSIKQ